MSGVASLRQLRLAASNRSGVLNSRGVAGTTTAAARRDHQSSSPRDGTSPTTTTTTTAAFRTWKGRWLSRHPSRRTPANRFDSQSRGVCGRSITVTTTTTTTKLARTTIPAVTRRSFLSDRPSPHELRGSSSGFTPLEDFCMDALAWTIALGLWCVPFTEFQSNDDTGDDGDAQDRPLEYREDYGPSVSPWHEQPKLPSGDDKKEK
mmetsp:Transcript_27631/g.64873  ORF Transcript_27631/g.64873 Transcript_27631/m.64873 type:complete len:206 (+) Transcript_27631:397-1014(+)